MVNENAMVLFGQACLAKGFALASSIADPDNYDKWQALVVKNDVLIDNALSKLKELNELV